MRNVWAGVVTLVALALPFDAAWAAPVYYQGVMDAVEISGQSCRGGDRGTRPVDLVLEQHQSASGTVVEGYLSGDRIEPGKISGGDPGRLYVTYPGPVTAGVRQHRLILRFDGDAVTGELWEAHLEQNEEGCNFDHAFITARKMDAGAAAAKQEQVKKLFEARELEQQAFGLPSGEKERAESLLLQALSLRKEAFGPLDAEVATGLSCLGLFYAGCADYKKAEDALVEALEMRGRVLGEDHELFIESLNYLAHCYLAEQKYRKAEPLLWQALAAKEKAFGSGDLGLVDTLMDLGGVLAQEGRFMEGESQMKRSLEIVEYAYGHNHPEVIKALTALGDYYQAGARTDDALQRYRQAQDIREQLDPGSASAADGLLALGLKYLAARRYPDAIACGLGALATRENLFGPNDLVIAKTKSYLAEVYLASGRNREAEELFKSALSMKEQLLGLSDPEVVKSVYELAEFYFNTGRAAEGTQLIARTLKDGNRTLHYRQ